MIVPICIRMIWKLLLKQVCNNPIRIIDEAINNVNSAGLFITNNETNYYGLFKGYVGELKF